MNTDKLSDYNAAKYRIDEEEVDIYDDFEFLMLNLRTIFGVDYDEYQRRFGVSFVEKYMPAIKFHQYEHYFVFTDKSVHLTYDGMMVLDMILIDICE